MFGKKEKKVKPDIFMRHKLNKITLVYVNISPFFPPREI
jgi:hypothetical protein